MAKGSLPAICDCLTQPPTSSQWGKPDSFNNGNGSLNTVVKQVVISGATQRNSNENAAPVRGRKSRIPCGALKLPGFLRRLLNPKPPSPRLAGNHGLLKPAQGGFSFQVLPGALGTSLSSHPGRHQPGEPLVTREGAMRLRCLPKPHVPPVGSQSRLGRDQQAAWQSSKPSYQETGSVTPLPNSSYWLCCCQVLALGQNSNPQPTFSTRFHVATRRDTGRSVSALPMEGGGLENRRWLQDGKLGWQIISFFWPCSGQARQPSLEIALHTGVWGGKYNLETAPPPSPIMHSR